MLHHSRAELTGSTMLGSHCPGICHAGPVEFCSKNGAARIDKAMLDIIKDTGGDVQKSLAGGQQLSKLQLTQEGLAKVRNAW